MTFGTGMVAEGWMAAAPEQTSVLSAAGAPRCYPEQRDEPIILYISGRIATGFATGTMVRLVKCMSVTR